MTNPLKHVHEGTAFSEASHVVRTAIVVADEQTYRIEVLKAYAPASSPYTAHCWAQRTVTVPPASLVLPSQVEHEDVTIWGCHRFSSPVEGKSPKQALAHALSCLAEQHAPADV
jgi:hypothetical protein